MIKKTIQSKINSKSFRRDVNQCFQKAYKMGGFNHSLTNPKIISPKESYLIGSTAPKKMDWKDKINAVEVLLQKVKPVIEKIPIKNEQETKWVNWCTSISIPAEVVFSWEELPKHYFFHFAGPVGSAYEIGRKEFFRITKKEDGKFNLEAICPTEKHSVEVNKKIRELESLIVGTSRGYEIKQTLFGVGYRAVLEKNNTLRMELGRSHEYFLKLDNHIQVKFGRKNNRMLLKSPSLTTLSGRANAVRSWRRPDVYKGKGVRDFGKIFRKKEGKKKK